MILLNNGCSRSEMKGTPSNWNTPVEKATAKLLKVKWRIYYRYYDPAFKNDPKKWGMMVQISGMNDIKDLEKQQAATKVLLEDEVDRIDNKLFNPVSGRYHVITDRLEEISPSTPFIDALVKAAGMIQCVPRMMEDIKCVILKRHPC